MPADSCPTGRTKRTATGASHIRGQNPEGSEACRPAGGAADEVRAGDQSQDGEAIGLTIPQSVLYRADKVIK